MNMTWQLENISQYLIDILLGDKAGISLAPTLLKGSDGSGKYGEFPWGREAHYLVAVTKNSVST